MDSYRRSPAIRQSHIERQTLALEQIAENTKPKDVGIAKVSLDRDKTQALLDGTIDRMEANAEGLMLAMEQPDMMQRGMQIRNILQSMLNYTAQYKRDNQ